MPFTCGEMSAHTGPTRRWQQESAVFPRVEGASAKTRANAAADDGRLSGIVDEHGAFAIYPHRRPRRLIGLGRGSGRCVGSDALRARARARVCVRGRLGRLRPAAVVAWWGGIARWLRAFGFVSVGGVG